MEQCSHWKQHVEICAFCLLNAMTLDSILVLIVYESSMEGSDIYNNGETIHIPVVKPKGIVDPTGAGDSYRAGFLTGILNKFPLETCGKMGALAGTYCIEEAGPQNTKYNLDQFKSRYEEVWKEKME